MLRRLQVDPVVADFLLVAAQAAGLVHLRQQLIPQGQDRFAGGFPGMVPAAVVVAVDVHPCQQQIDLVARHLSQPSLVAADQQFGQRGGSGTMGARRQDLGGPDRSVVAVEESGLRVLDQSLVADVEGPGPAAGQVDPPRHPFGAAMAADAMAVEHRLHLRRISEQAGSPGLRSDFRRVPAHGQRPFTAGDRGQVVFADVAALAGTGGAGRGLDKGPHALHQAAILVQRLEIQGLAARRLEIRRPIRLDRHHAKHILHIV